jgi:catechol 2,3-dioxygenase-like lactoylglutathione lyase family enzyme
MIVGMNHFTVIAQDKTATLDFYVGLLGMTVGYRPDLGFDGAWLYAGGETSQTHAILHMYFDRAVPQPPAGVIDHMAFSASNLKAVKARFDAAGLKYELRRQAGAGGVEGIWQLFSHDPNGAKVELDFDPSETL